MPAPSSHSALSSKIVIAHYLLGGTAFLIMVLLLLFGGGTMEGHYFQPQLLAITHVGVLGWISTMIFGALYQFLPNMLNAPLYSKHLPPITLACLTGGTAVLAYGFWTFDVASLIPIGGGMVLLAFFLFAFNILMTLRKGQKGIRSDLIGTALIWLLVTGSLGLLVGVNFHYPFLSTPHLEFLQLHAHFGIFGWFLLLIMGVASEMIPMFLLAKGLSEKPLKLAYYGVNGGLFGMVLAFFLEWPQLLRTLSSFFIVAGLAAFGLYLREAYRKRLRKRSDIGMRISTAAFLLATLPVVFGGAALFLEDLKWAIAYGTSILLGSISLLVIGMTHKTLPLIVHSWKGEVSEDPYERSLARLQFWAYLPGLFLLLSGIFLQIPHLIKGGGILLLIVGLLYQISMFRTVFGKELKPFPWNAQRTSIS